MKAESYWQQFLSSGKVEDYLSYSRISRKDALTEEGRQDFPAPNDRRKQKEGENPYAGSYYSDGNDLKSDAYR